MINVTDDANATTDRLASNVAMTLGTITPIDTMPRAPMLMTIALMATINQARVVLRTLMTMMRQMLGLLEPFARCGSHKRSIPPRSPLRSN